MTSLGPHRPLHLGRPARVAALSRDNADVCLERHCLELVRTVHEPTRRTSLTNCP